MYKNLYGRRQGVKVYDAKNRRSMPLEKSVRLAVILSTILDLAIGIKSSLFKKWVDIKFWGIYKNVTKNDLNYQNVTVLI